jgi:hypothetical protein
MFIGHFGVGFGAKKAAPRVSLGTLFMAAQFIDLLWPTLLLLNLEQVEIAPGNTAVTPLNFTHYPITHSLLMVCVWGALFGLVYWLVRKNGRGAVLLGLCVVSHWVLDLVVHRPDLPIYPGGSQHVGLGLWNSVIGTVIVEGIIYIVGIILYLRTTQAKNRAGSLGFWGLVIFLAIIHIANLTGPPPPSVQMIAWAGQLQWLFVLWAYWVDRNRTVTIGTP